MKEHVIPGFRLADRAIAAVLDELNCWIWQLKRPPKTKKPEVLKDLGLLRSVMHRLLTCGNGLVRALRFYLWRCNWRVALTVVETKDSDGVTCDFVDRNIGCTGADLFKCPGNQTRAATARKIDKYLDCFENQVSLLRSRSGTTC